MIDELIAYLRRSYSNERNGSMWVGGDTLLLPQPFIYYSLLLTVSGVTFETPGRRKLSQFMAYHVFGNVYRNVDFAIMYSNGLSYHIRNNHRRA
jgi:hypothetical protein